MADQRTDAAERSAHVARGSAVDREPACIVCGKGWRLASYAAKRGDGVPVVEVCSAACAERAGWGLTHG